MRRDKQWKLKIKDSGGNNGNTQQLKIWPYNWLFECTVVKFAMNSKTVVNREYYLVLLTSLQDRLSATYMQIIMIYQLECGWVADKLEGRAANQRSLDRLEKWTVGNLMKFSKDKCKVLHLGLSSTMHHDSLGARWLEDSFSEKAHWSWWKPSWTCVSNVPRDEDQQHPWL